VQRLEFLRDAILDHIIIVYFFKQYYTTCTPELLTDLRKYSVNNHCYAHASVKNGLHKLILYSDEQMAKVINDLENSGRSFSGQSHGMEPGAGLPKVVFFNTIICFYSPVGSSAWLSRPLLPFVKYSTLPI
jgi:endoribonuclease Dicer